MFRKALLTTAAAIAMIALSSVARADTITLTGVNGTGVTAQVSNYSLVGNTFTFTIKNTSVAPSSTGTITNIGFDLPGARSGFTLVSSTNANYSLVGATKITSGAQNVTGSTDFDTTLFNGNGNPTFGGGSVNGGIAGGTSATFSISGNFSGLTADQIAHSIFARFQAVNGGGSDVAANNTPGVPEPMTMILFGTGLAGIAARARRRRNGKA
jgi:hypothetical protein